MDVALQFLGGLLLLAGVWLGYRLWVEPRSESLDAWSKGLLLLVLLTLLGALIGAPFWWFDVKRAFAWDLPPLAGRMLAAAALAFVIASGLTLMRPSRARLRLLLVLDFVYLAPLAVIIVAFHLDRFDFASPITYGFFALAVTMIGLSAAYLRLLPRLTGFAPETSAPPGPTARAWLLLTALVTGPWGLALLITDHGFSRRVWAWPGDHLSGSLIGVMLLAVAAGALVSLASRDSALVMLAVEAAYGLGVGLAALWNVTLDKPLPEVYFAVFGLLGLVSLLILTVELASVWRRASAPRSAPAAPSG